MIGKQVWSLTPAKIILGGFFHDYHGSRSSDPSFCIEDR